METPFVVTAATFIRRDPDFVDLLFNDGTGTSIYLNDGSPRLQAHDLLDAWLDAGNEIADPAS